MDLEKQVFQLPACPTRLTETEGQAQVRHGLTDLQPRRVLPHEGGGHLGWGVGAQIGAGAAF